MRRKTWPVNVLFIIALTTGISFGTGSPYIHNTFIPIPCCGKGALPFAEIETIRSMDELTNYFSFLECEVSQLSQVPNFAKEVAFGIVTGFCKDHHTIESRSPEGITLSNDTFTIIIHSHTRVDSIRELPLGFCTMLITLDRKYLQPIAAAPPIVRMQEKNGSVAVSQRGPASMISIVSRKQHPGVYTITGRSFGKTLSRSSGLIILTGEQAGIKLRIDR